MEFKEDFLNKTGIEFDKFYNEYKTTLFVNIVMRYIYDRTIAYEIIDNTFFKLVNNWDIYDNTKSCIKTWISRICLNECRAYCKDVVNKKIYYCDDMKDIPINTEYENNFAIDEENINEILLALSRIPWKFRNLIIKRLLQNEYRNDVCKELNINLSAQDILYKKGIYLIKELIKWERKQNNIYTI
jgi:RNA polymerase sigma factor (sigma-70 family)